MLEKPNLIHIKRDYRNSLLRRVMRRKELKNSKNTTQRKVTLKKTIVKYPRHNCNHHNRKLIKEQQQIMH